tara:strand:+ start:50816 stop:52618 length:1803 start_codon:yes stop_codon:yes gene_type:complete
MANGVYRQACDRIVSYFITEIEVIGDDREEKNKFKDFLYDHVGIQNLLHTIGMDYLCYGNSFTSTIVPIRRYLSCPKCGLELPLGKVYNEPTFKFQWKNFQFNADCPKCSHTGVWKHVDRRSLEEDNLIVKRWSPHEMELLHDPLTDNVSYIWKIPEDYKKQVREGTLYHLERANWEIIQAVKNDQHLRFDKDIIYHMKEDALSGVKNRGWGISRVLSNFRQAWYVQVLHRYNEAIALDYVVPFRVLTPMPRGGPSEFGDPVLTQDLGGFAARVNNMLKRRRKDPAGWNVLPFPIQYQALGGDATQLAPYQLIEMGRDDLLNSVGVPVEMYKGSLSLTTAPAALRLFESSWSHLVHNLNAFLSDLVEKVSRALSWDSVDVRLAKVTHADDLNRQMAKLQLMMGQQISQTTGLKSVGMDFEEETRRKLDEEQFMAEETAKMQQRMEQMAQMEQMAPPGGAAMGGPGGMMPPGGDPMAAGGMPPGGAMPPGGDPMAAGGMPPAGPAGAAASQFGLSQPTQPHQPITPEEMMAKANEVAQQLMTMPETQRKSELIRLKRSDPTLHSLVSSVIDDIRQQAQTQGQQIVLQQQYGGGMGGGMPMG